MGQLKNILTKRNVNICDENGYTLLILASCNGKLEICAALLNRRALVDIQNNFGWAALHVAAFHGYVQICTLLLKNNACVNQQIKDGASPLFTAAQEGHVHLCTLLLDNNAHVNQERNDGMTPLMIASFLGHAEVCEFLLLNNADINLKDENGHNALFHAVRQKRYDTCKLLIQQGVDVNLADNNGKSILESVNATDDETIISLIRKHKHTKTVNKEIEETRKHLKKLQMKQILDRKRQRLAEIENAKTRIDELKQLLLEKKKERGTLELHVEFLIENINGRNKGLSALTTGNSQIKLLLQQQNTECQAKVNNMMDKISDINQSINKYTTEIKTTEMRTAEYEKQKREYEFYNKCFQEGKYGKIIKELNKECPICFEEMLTPIKIFQCSQGHLLCENCFKKVSDSAKVCPFCKRDVVTTPIRNRALEEAIENEARKDMGAANRN